MQEHRQDRREFVFAAAAGLGALLLPGCGAKSPTPEARPAAEALQPGLEAFSQAYLASGEIRDQAALNNLFLRTEHARFLEAGQQARADFRQFASETWQPFERSVQQRFSHLEQLPEAAQDPLLNLKKALFDVLGPELFYNRDRNSVIDPIVNQRLQCRSGTQLFLLLARSIAAERLAADQTLVVIYTDTHELPGLLSPDGGLTGYEMTTRGAGLVEFGRLEDCQVPIRVCRADHVMAQSILGTRVLVDQVVIHDTLDSLPDDNAYQKPIASLLASGSKGGTLSNLVDGLMNSGSECFSYSSGKVEVPKGDQGLASFNFMSPRSYNRQSTAPVPQTAEIEKQQQNLLDMLSPLERRAVLDYLNHNFYFVQCWNRHAEIINAGSSAAETYQQLNALVQEMDRYWDGNGLDRLQGQAVAAFRRHSLAPKYDPARTFDRINYNLEVCRKRAVRG